jgi:hypothetical protein
MIKIIQKMIFTHNVVKISSFINTIQLNGALDRCDALL